MFSFCNLVSRCLGRSGRTRVIDLGETFAQIVPVGAVESVQVAGGDCPHADVGLVGGSGATDLIVDAPEAVGAVMQEEIESSSASGSDDSSAYERQDTLMYIPDAEEYMSEVPSYFSVGTQSSTSSESA
eukprot:TRINITY_DN40401_c0_g1_i1.p1 TRINITY_DN40401_c0_g1~~TRINITY_DN40401_c0_g1_i1.p1  ORF type:complete len:129 (-),score=18.24 TRINITY_DN40401_c0_g1_i1:276-662(-)